MVGWDASRNAARAVADAMPFLAKAKAIDVVIVASERPKSDEVAGADIGQHLARHGLKVEVKRIVATDTDVANTHPVACGRHVRRLHRDGRLRPFAPARVHPRRRDARHPVLDDGAGADVALTFGAPPTTSRPMRLDLEALTHHDVLPDGTRVLMRPLEPEDAALYPEFVAHVTPEDTRLRFFSAISELSEERIGELTHLDYDTRDGVHRDRRGDRPDARRGAAASRRGPPGGEYAVIVRSALKGHGLGWLLMQRMIEYARMIGLKRIHGQVLAENTTMLRMCAELGFHVDDDPNGSGIKLVTLDLARSP